MIKLIASDMDGTLLNNMQQISAKNVQAIKEAQQKGIEFLIATGRSYQEVEGLLNQNSISCGCILMNGSEYRDKNGKIVEKINLDKYKTKQIIKTLDKSRICTRIMTNDGIYTTSSRQEAFRAFVDMIKEYNNVNEEKAIEFVKDNNYFTKLRYIEDLDKFLSGKFEVRKILGNFKSKEITEDMKKRVSLIDGIAVSASFSNNIEITDKNAQKGIMLKKVANELGIKKDEVMVIGDSFNDYSMFTEFNESVAMGNAISEIKNIAKYITETNENNGVSSAIGRILF